MITQGCLEPPSLIHPPTQKKKKKSRLAASTQSVQKATTLQGEEKERSTIWDLVMVMPGAQGQG